MFVDPISHMPPILQTPGLKLIDLGQYEDGCFYFLFTAARGRVKSVTVVIRTDEKATWLYGYVIRDSKTRTEVAYHGIHGDPDLDELGELEAY